MTSEMWVVPIAFAFFTDVLNDSLAKSPELLLSMLTPFCQSPTDARATSEGNGKTVARIAMIATKTPSLIRGGFFMMVWLLPKLLAVVGLYIDTLPVLGFVSQIWP
jgi:hypothetical protein